MSATPSTSPRQAASAPHAGPLDWRKLVEWLSQDGVISIAEATRTISRCSQVQSAQAPMVRLASVSMTRVADGKPLDIETMTTHTHTHTNERVIKGGALQRGISCRLLRKSKEGGTTAVMAVREGPVKGLSDNQSPAFTCAPENRGAGELWKLCWGLGVCCVWVGCFGLGVFVCDSWNGRASHGKPSPNL